MCFEVITLKDTTALSVCLYVFLCVCMCVYVTVYVCKGLRVFVCAYTYFIEYIESTGILCTGIFVYVLLESC